MGIVLTCQNRVGKFWILYSRQNCNKKKLMWEEIIR